MRLPPWARARRSTRRHPGIGSTARPRIASATSATGAVISSRTTVTQGTCRVALATRCVWSQWQHRLIKRRIAGQAKRSTAARNMEKAAAPAAVGGLTSYPHPIFVSSHLFPLLYRLFFVSSLSGADPLWCETIRVISTISGFVVSPCIWFLVSVLSRSWAIRPPL